jgi:sugar phosphate isomerase/epimerase
LPIAEFVRAVRATGFRGYLSVEVFDGKFEEKYGDDLRRFAKKAMDACQRLVAESQGQ